MAPDSQTTRRTRYARLKERSPVESAPFQCGSPTLLQAPPLGHRCHRPSHQPPCARSPSSSRHSHSGHARSTPHIPSCTPCAPCWHQHARQCSPRTGCATLTRRSPRTSAGGSPGAAVGAGKSRPPSCTGNCASATGGANSSASDTKCAPTPDAHFAPPYAVQAGAGGLIAALSSAPLPVAGAPRDRSAQTSALQVGRRAAGRCG